MQGGRGLKTTTFSEEWAIVPPLPALEELVVASVFIR